MVDHDQDAAVTELEDEVPSSWRAHALLSAVPIGWVGFHLWEQWAAFAGREAWVTRMSATSVGPASLLGEILGGILPVVLWLALEVRLRLRGREPVPLRFAMAEDPTLAHRLGLLTRAGSWLFALWVLYHAGWLWTLKLLAGAEPLRTWVVLRDELGTWIHAGAHAVGLTSLAVHVWATLPRLVVAYGLAQRPQGRREARLSGLIVAVGLLLLGAQLVGEHAAGRGTLWSTEAPQEEP